MTIEGELIVMLDWDGRRVGRVAVRSTRPLSAAKMLIARTPEQACAAVALLFSICGKAQSVAAAGAAEAALAIAPSSGTLAWREFAVVAETVQEYLWGLLIDWPRLMGQEAQSFPVAEARRLLDAGLKGFTGASALPGAVIDEPDPALRAELAASLDAIAAKAIYGQRLQDWLTMDDLAGFGRWLQCAGTAVAARFNALLASDSELGRSAVALMPHPLPAAMRSEMVSAMEAGPEFMRTPQWRGEAVETGALARMHDHPLVTAGLERWGQGVASRLLARLVELALMLRRLGGKDPFEARSNQCVPLQRGDGLASVQTARGLLMHRVRIAAGRVAEYRIIAPTEWNFHPRGALVRGLEGYCAPDASALPQAAHLVAYSLDPCVAFRVEVGHA